MKRLYITVTGTECVQCKQYCANKSQKPQSNYVHVCVSQTIRKLCNISYVYKYNFKFITGLNLTDIIFIIIIIIIFCLIKE